MSSAEPPVEDSSEAHKPGRGIHCITCPTLKCVHAFCKLPTWYTFSCIERDTARGVKSKALPNTQLIFTDAEWALFQTRLEEGYDFEPSGRYQFAHLLFITIFCFILLHMLIFVSYNDHISSSI